MSEMTRRTVMRGGVMGLIAAAGVAGSSKVAEAKGMAGFVHVFAFQWKAGTSPEQIEKARVEIAAFQGVVPGLVSVRVGKNQSEKNRGYTFGGVMEFVDQAAFEAYTVHPAHKALLVWLVPLIDAVELDLLG